MGTYNSKDTRRISFDNTFAFNTALAVQKSIQDEHDILDLNSITAVEKSNELLFPETTKNLDLEKECGEGDYWGNRIDYLKKEHRIINKIIEQEYEKTLENTSKLLEPERITEDKLNKIKPCYELRKQIMKCYEENRHQTLVCAPLVEAFNQCVTSFSLEP